MPATFLKLLVLKFPSLGGRFLESLFQIMGQNEAKYNNIYCQHMFAIDIAQYDQAESYETSLFLFLYFNNRYHA